jgi:hypothetical protein
MMPVMAIYQQLLSSAHNDEPVFAVQNPTLVASRRKDLGKNGIATPLM